MKSASLVHVGQGQSVKLVNADSESFCAQFSATKRKRTSPDGSDRDFQFLSFVRCSGMNIGSSSEKNRHKTWNLRLESEDEPRSRSPPKYRSQSMRSLGVPAEIKIAVGGSSLHRQHAILVRQQ